MGKLHDSGSYRVRAARVRELANADPTTRCWRCGALASPGDPWTAGHVRDSDPSSPLRAEHASCNYRAGQRLGRERDKNSEDWYGEGI